METREVEKQLLLIPGVTAARVVGHDAPTEVHIVASAKRPVRQIVRDAQSLLAAGFGFEIDHRIVSVVTLEDGSSGTVNLPDPVAAEEQRDRPILEKVTTAVGPKGSWVRVDIRWPDNDVSHGARYMGHRRPERARSTAQALIIALTKKLASKGVAIEIDELVIHRIGSEESVIVRAAFTKRGKTTLVAGTAVVQDDVVSAAARAVLHAVNRNVVLTWQDRSQDLSASGSA